MRKQVLTDDAQDRIAEFQTSYTYKHGCKCWISPPCAYCTHPDNPHNVQEEDGVWRELTPSEIRARRVKRKIDLTND